MSYPKTTLLRHPTVEKAYRLVEASVGVKHADVKRAIAAAELYTAKAATPKPQVVAALLFANHAFPHVKKMGKAVADLADFALKPAYVNTLVSAGDDPDKADIALAITVGQAKGVAKEISAPGFYIFDNVQRSLARLDAVTEDAAKVAGTSPLLVACAQEVVADAALRQAARIEKARNDSVFSKSGLPAHPLVEKVYDAERYHAFQVNPHVMPLDFVLAATRILIDEVDRIAPEVIAAALLNQSFARAGRIEYLYGARVAELHAETAPLIGLPRERDLSTPGAADIRAAFALVVADDERKRAVKGTKWQREEALYDVEQTARQLRDLIATGQMSPRLAKRAEAEALACEAVVHAPENAVVRKPGTARPLAGW